MAINLGGVNLLENAIVGEGQRWIYSADFNVDYRGQLEIHRIDVEVDDLELLMDSGAKVFILAHQGRYEDGTAKSLEPLIPYLRQKLDTGNVFYEEENIGETAVKFSKEKAKPGYAYVMGNTRFHEGEEKNDSVLASKFAELGDFAAIGGFGKAHRAHASNIGILSVEHLVGFLTRSQIKEMELLAPWAGKADAYSVAVLGGVKKEKITEGLAGFARTYDAIIPGGIVLNTIYLVQGKRIGSSIITDGGKSYESNVKEILDTSTAEIHIPKYVVVARKTELGFQDIKILDIDKGVPNDHMIADFVLPDSALQSLEQLVSQNGRLLLAGTPGIYIAGFSEATQLILEYMNKEGVKAVALGGDTAGEVKFEGPSSTGGGSALHYVAHGTTPVLEALKQNNLKISLYFYI